MFTLLVWDAKGHRSLCELGITLLVSHLPVVIAICVGINTTARGRCFKIGQTLSTHLSLQFMLSTYVGMLLLRLLFHFWMSGNEELVPFEGSLPKFLMSCSRLCRFASSLPQHLPEIVFFWQSAAFGNIAQAGELCCVRCDLRAVSCQV